MKNSRAKLLMALLAGLLAMTARADAGPVEIRMAYGGVPGVISPVLFRAARTMDVDGLTLLWKVAVPAAMPDIAVGLRVGFGLAFGVLVAAELIASESGMGHLIMEARELGHLGVKRNTPDYMPLNLTLRILGGEGANRLHQVLRTERALTYGAKADMDTLLESGDFEASTNTRSEATGEVLRLIVDQIWRLQRERVGERELSDAKAYLTGNFPLTIETPGDIARQVLNAVFYDLPLDELRTYRQRANAISPDDVQRVARAYLDPDRLTIVLVGNAAAFTDRLKKAGFGKYELITLDRLDRDSPDLKKH